jgi:hypothetical protein
MVTAGLALSGRYARRVLDHDQLYHFARHGYVPIPGVGVADVVVSASRAIESL